MNTAFSGHDVRMTDAVLASHRPAPRRCRDPDLAGTHLDVHSDGSAARLAPRGSPADRHRMSAGPTQNYDDATLGSWRPHPVLAVLVRGAVAVTPAVIALAFGYATHRWLPPARVGLHPWVWLVAQVACSTAVLLLVARAVRRLLPLRALLRLTLFLPDRSSSQVAVASRRHSPEVLRARLEGEAAPTRTDDEREHGAQLLELVGRLRAHDRGTFGHSKRVQAYAALIGTELGLSRIEAAQLGWAALLHDIGKLGVPREILTKPGRPTDAEWRVVACHPEHGEALTAPLAAWLGPWLDAVGQHHERWDGAGYPHGLAGTQISLGARIIAVADAFDVITSARSYKKPLSATAARSELARCAGTQFDPDVVRAFLAVGLGSLRAVAGPVSLVAAVPGLRSMPWPDLAGAASRVAAAGPLTAAASLAGGVALVLGLASPGAPLLAPLTPGDDPAPVASRLAGAVTAATGLDGSRASGDTGAGSPDRSDAGTGGADRGPDDVAGVPGTGGGTTGASDASGTSAAVPSGAGAATADPAACRRARTGGGGLARAVLVRCDLAGAHLTGDLSGANLAGADLSGATLTDVDLTGARLTGANLRGAVATRTTFDRADLTGADLTGASVTASSFRGTALGPTTLQGATLVDCVLDPGAGTSPAAPAAPGPPAAAPGAPPAAPAPPAAEPAAPAPPAPAPAPPAPAPAAPAQGDPGGAAAGVPAGSGAGGTGSGGAPADGRSGARP